MRSYDLETVRVDENESVATITIDNPPVNAITEKVLDDLQQAFEIVEDQENVRAVILTAQGSRSFVAGVDVNIFSRKDISGRRDFISKIHKTFRMIDHFPKPLICAINSHAAGNGCELTMVCDIRIANEEATFTFPECKFGVVSAGGTTQRLPRLIPQGKALYYLFTSEKMKAREAHELGLVDFIKPLEDLIPFAAKIAHKIAENSPITVSAVKKLVKQGRNLPMKVALQEELKQGIESCQTSDFLEGITAYLEKRVPIFKGC
ncbi:crotonase [Desulfosarcina widdelii]|uniref:Crotonase n=1 Tax=Desulfosarcina widdelii TaxID=947919 RepID=A0A5K7Z820_9BACT|nr:enoyl-CoA hydratase/isomerase family protein [Desulfosarcina widdelii]BBO74624.1 crotonase [Desulfosarcina widdelii]